MAVVGIVAEYNPFHLGHLHQFEEIRKEFGPDTEIVVLLAGNFVQRGEVALLDKYTRAQAAVDCGANLVLELPFPWCCSSAEFYARGAMSLFTELGVSPEKAREDACRVEHDLSEETFEAIRKHAREYR